MDDQDTIIEPLILPKEEAEKIERQVIEARPKLVKPRLSRKADKPIFKHKPKEEILYGQHADEFLKEFIDNGGNATQAALKVFNCKNRATAAAVGHNYLQKMRGVAAIYMEERGASYGRLLDIAIDKAYTSKNPEYWDRLMKIAGYHDFLDKKPLVQIANVTQVQKELMSEYVEGDLEELDSDAS